MGRRSLGLGILAVVGGHHLRPVILDTPLVSPSKRKVEQVLGNCLKTIPCLRIASLVASRMEGAALICRMAIL